MCTWNMFLGIKILFLFSEGSKPQQDSANREIAQHYSWKHERRVQKVFFALWLAGNSTKTDLQSISMVLNATRGNIVRQLKEVRDNLTEQVHYLCYLYLRLSQPHFNHSMWGLLHTVLL